MKTPRYLRFFASIVISLVLLSLLIDSVRATSYLPPILEHFNFQATSTPAAPLNLSDPDSIVYWLSHDMAFGQIDSFNQIMTNDTISYGPGYSGGRVSMDKTTFLTQLGVRITYIPTCIGYSVTDDNKYIMVWTKNWQPMWDFQGKPSSEEMVFGISLSPTQIDMANFVPSSAILDSPSVKHKSCPVFAPTAQESPVSSQLDMTSAESIAGWINYGLQHGKADVFNDVISNMPTFWAIFMPDFVNPVPCTQLMGQWCDISKDEFIQEINKRIQSKPQCAYSEGGGNFAFFVETWGWNPFWVWPYGNADSVQFIFQRNKTASNEFQMTEVDFVQSVKLPWLANTPCPVNTHPLIQPSQPSAPVVNSFSTGDAIRIGSDVYIIIDGQRRLIPNPETLYAIGIQISTINNKGFSDTDLNTIPQGVNIPDVNTDPLGIEAFINQYFPSTTPSPVPVISTPKSLVCSILPLFCPSTILASTNTSCHPQCVEEARLKRPDLNIWASNVHVADTILARAQTQPVFPQSSMLMQVRVRDQNDQPQTGDLIIWPSISCQGVYAPVDFNGNKLPGGHIGYVANYLDGHLIVHDANWDNNCGIRNEEIKINACMKFITSPNQVGSLQSVPSQNPIGDPCTQYSGFRWLECIFLGIK